VSGATVFSAFYDQLKSIREYHRKFPSAPSTESAEMALVSEVLDDAPEEGFTGEEAEGRFVDMHSLHDAFLNLKGVERIDYCTYLKRCADVASIPKAVALAGAYPRYVKALRAYWLSFLSRTQPLMPVSKLLEAAEADFRGRWEARGVSRWQQGQATDDEAAPLDLSTCSSAAELQSLGMDALKTHLARLGLKVGGSLAQRAERLFLTKTTPVELMPKQHLAKPATKAEQTSSITSAATSNGKDHPAETSASASAFPLALMEEQVCRLGELLGDTLEVCPSQALIDVAQCALSAAYAVRVCLPLMSEYRRLLVVVAHRTLPPWSRRSRRVRTTKLRGISHWPQRKRPRLKWMRQRRRMRSRFTTH